MAQPKVEKLITAIDIGSWKVSALIAGRTDTGELAILGTGQRESRGAVSYTHLTLPTTPYV